MQNTKPRRGRPRECMSKKPRGRKVAALRKKGLSFSQIGAALGIHKQHAHQIHKRILQEQAT